MSDFNGLTIALSKGRILDETLPLFAQAGITPLEDMNKSRKLIFHTSDPKVRLLMLRASDVPTYVEHGAADVGIAGKDVLMEYDAQVYELLDLNIAKCRLMTAGVAGEPLPNRRLRIATKYVNVAREYFASQGVQVDLIKLYGSMELAPLVGLGDMIVDVVDTGNTLRANGLEPRDEICQVSSRLIANPASYKQKLAQLQPILDVLQAAIAKD
ncbi:ATP phosphoribosyltransferase [Moraxella caviae]|uniref:ATP phosphoribosyltransferase n=1 Tax=Moraxella caviae TaxID=34060 RepID=A0A1T0A1K5_9GAMM|nr:ATP phosphoribosyltransferase [Moraxella caviae]OOR89584.1 ATP phosphoribosyltransferase [Moraxella caviae]STZ10265.1 ATP phosphoribosyltransferase [Moraxella caviae]VEW11262.1 ATP phosphoribosyltransferase [Moraxella caviae]VEW13232.1 ATP phosphoribosyltransferase [Moraxella caviae]